ncbi:MAG: DUF72 domain-containing protein [Thermoplasmatota archaeon]
MNEMNEMEEMKEMGEMGDKDTMIHLGTSGWYYGHWQGRFYPPELERRQWLDYYAQRFSTVEVNASFYRLPSARMVESWRRRTPEGFVLAFKGSRVVTHRRRLEDVEGYLGTFYERISLAREKRGPVLWQLPPSLERDDGLLESFLAALNQEVPQALEFRHRSWLARPVYRLLERYGMALCVASCPDLEPVVEVTAPFVYIRWHGPREWYASGYTDQELQRWAHVIRSLEVPVYGYFNNDARGYALDNCRTLREMLG